MSLPSADIRRILLIEDDMPVRNAIVKMVERVPDCAVFWTVKTPGEALETLAQQKVDLVLLSMALPGNGALAFLQKRAEAGNSAPVLLLSAPTTPAMRVVFDALRLGAADFVPRPAGLLSAESDSIFQELREKAMVLTGMSIVEPPPPDDDDLEPPRAKRKPPEPKPVRRKPKERKVVKTSGKLSLVALGFSLGGVKAMIELLTTLPKTFKVPFLVVQQVHPSMIKPLAEAFAELTKYEVTEARHHDEVRPGVVYLAPGDRQMGVIRNEKQLLIEVTYTDKVSGRLPSIDYLFRTLADTCGNQTLCVLLSGADKDGVSGLRLLRSKGAIAVSQDKDSAVSFEKAQLALDQGIVEESIPLARMAKRLREIFNLSRKDRI